jgi:EmrB/QacA subfamily drug resistance transporter
MTPFSASVVNLALPAMGSSLQISFKYIIWIPISYLIVIASLETTFGRLGDSSGRRNLFALGIVIFTAGSIIAGLSNSVVQLISGRTIQALGGAGIDACGLAILTGAFPLANRGRALGIYTTAIYAGGTAGPVAGGFLVQIFGWRSIFFVNVPIGILSVIFTLIYIKKDEISRRLQGFDLLGSLTLGTFLATLVLILSREPLSSDIPLNLLIDLLSCVSLVAFVLIEIKVAETPILDFHLFARNRLFTGGIATSFANYYTSFGSLLIISVYLQSVLQYSPERAGLILLVQPIFQVIAAPISGTLSDRVPARILSSAGMISKFVGFLVLAFLGTNPSPETIVISLCLVGIGHGFFSSPNVNSVMGSLPVSKFGVASGTLGTTRSTAQLVGIAMLGGIVASQLPVGSLILYGSTTALSQSLFQDFVGGMKLAFITASAISGLGAVTSLLRGKNPVDASDANGIERD